jgi:eukaryotic-like serine/threonine-protein kinase
MGGVRGTGSAERVEQASTDDAPTLLDFGGEPAPPSVAPTLATAADALFADEVGRTRVFLVLGLVLAGVAALAVLVVGGDLLAVRLVLAGIGVCIAAVLWLLWVTRRGEGYTTARVSTVGLIVVSTAFAGVMYWGVFSPVCALIVLGIYFFSQGASLRAKTAIYLYCSVLHALFGGLVIGGVISDPGLIRAEGATTDQRIASIVIVELIYLCAFVLAHIGRRTTLDAVERLEEAVKAVAQREAVLKEAGQELERAAWIGGPGRFTDVTLGRFKLGVVIGRGAMGEVYEAIHLEDRYAAAVKLLHRNILADPEAIARFAREARAAQALASPHVVRVFEIGGADAPIPYLAMERLDGHDLAYHLRLAPRFTVAKTIELVEQVAAGLAAARTAGIVHRDLKPQNLFLHESSRSSPTWKILDFGCSKLVGHHGSLTQGQLLGTPAYMPPEQANGAGVDHRADVYSLAVIAYRALTGHPAFPGDHVLAVLGDVVARMPRRPSDLVQLPADVDAVFAIALAKEPASRFQTAEELSVALNAAVRSQLDPDLRRRAEQQLVQWPWGGRRR